MLAKLTPVLVQQARRMAALAAQLKTPGIGAFQLLGEPLLSEHYAKAGFDAVLVDMQHGIYSEKTGFDCLQRLEKFPNCFPMVRVADNNQGLIQRALDAGALGVLAPMINNAEEAKFLVQQCRFPPNGTRSWGPTRALALGIDPATANNRVKVFAMIETRQAMENLDDILDVDGLDGAFVGPCDLSISLGAPPLGNPTEKTVVDAITKVREGCKKRGKIGMLFCDGRARAEEALREGWSLAFPGADLTWMLNTVQHIADAKRG